MSRGRPARVLIVAGVALAAFMVGAPTAFAADGVGLWGRTDDKVITYFAFGRDGLLRDSRHRPVADPDPAGEPQGAPPPGAGATSSPGGPVGRPGAHAVDVVQGSLRADGGRRRPDDRPARAAQCRRRRDRRASARRLPRVRGRRRGPGAGAHRRGPRGVLRRRRPEGDGRGGPAGRPPRCSTRWHPGPRGRWDSAG